MYSFHLQLGDSIAQDLSAEQVYHPFSALFGSTKTQLNELSRSQLTGYRYIQSE